MKNNDGFSTTVIERDLKKVVEALEVVGSELHHQVGRIETSVQPDTESENEHLTDLRNGYKAASRYLGILRNYQRARLRRQRGEEAPLPQADGEEDVGVDVGGRSSAYLE